MEKAVQKTNSPLKQSKLYEEAMHARPSAKTDPKVLQELTAKLDLIANKFNISVDELLNNAEHSAEFKEEYLEARRLACQIALLKK